MPDGDEDQLSRRDMLKGMGAVAGASMLSGSVGKHLPERPSFSLDGLMYPINFLQRVDWRNASMVQKGIGHLDGADWDDYEYNKDHFWQKITTLGAGIASGNNMNEFQKYSAAEGYVSTPDDGIGASITGHGRISSLFFPHTAFTTHLPYFTHEDGYLEGAKPHEGSFAGVELDEETTWLWDKEVDRPDEQFQYRDDAGMLDIGYEHDQFSIEETTYVLPDEQTLVRDYEIQNTGEEPIDGAFRYYTQANVNDNQQNFILWSSNDNRLTADETLQWNDLESDYELTIGMDAPVEDSTITAPLETVLESIIDLPVGDAVLESLLDLATDAYGLGEEIVAIEDDSLEGTYLGGTIETEIDLEPGETETVSVFLAGGEQTALPDDGDMHERQDTVEQYWAQWNDGIEAPEELTDREQDRYEQAVRTLGMMHDPETGAVPAAPNLQPMYYPSWIRDASIVSVALSQAGKPELAKDYLAGFLPTVQEDDGSFKQCYDASGEASGIFEIENDQQGIFAWAVHAVYEQTGDEQFLAEAWPAVKDALDYTVDAVVDNDLLAATPDYAEMPIDIRQSLYANAFAYRGLKDGAAMAEVMGEDGHRYETTAETIGEAAYEQFIEEPEEIYSEYTISGGNNGFSSIDSAVIWPTGWAEDFDAIDDLIGEFKEPNEDYKHGWVPGHLSKAAMLYNQGEDAMADQFTSDVYPHQNEAGDFVEAIEGPDEYYFASPLGWSQAAYLLAMDEKYTTQ